MPYRPASIRSCGCKVLPGERCIHMIERDRERKARFDQKRPSASKRLYDHEWRKARNEYLRLNPTCRFCGQPATVVDHVRPHKGNRALFWDRQNWQPLCTLCHSSIKQSRERRP